MENDVSREISFIEISSDSESPSDDELPEGLSDNSVVVVLFEQFILKCTLFGVNDESIRHIRSIFGNANVQFLTGDYFISFLRSAIENVKKENALRMVTDVGQCICTEKAVVLNGKGWKNAPVSEKFAQKRKSPQRMSGEFDDAKRKIIEFINNHAGETQKVESSNKSRYPLKSDDHSCSTTVDQCRCIVRESANLECDNTSIQNGVSRKHDLLSSDEISKRPIASLWLKSSNEQNDTNVCSQENQISNSSPVINCNSWFRSSSESKESNPNNACNEKSQKQYNDKKDDKYNDDNDSDDDDDDDVVIVSVIQHNKEQRSISSKPINHDQSLSTPADDSKLPKNRSLVSKEGRKQLLISSMKKRLKFYDQEIKRLMEAEVTLDEMANSDSSYIKESKLKAKYIRLYKKLCRLQGTHDDDSDLSYSKVRIEGCAYPEVNREAEKFVRFKRKFPDFFDIKSVVSNANKGYKLNLKPQEEIDIAREVFSEIGDKLQRKRKKEFARYSGSYLTDMGREFEDPAMNDASLKKKLKENKRISKINTERMFKHFAKLQYEGCDKSSSDDEEIEKTVLEAQRKKTPKQVKHCPVEICNNLNGNEHQSASNTSNTDDVLLANTTPRNVIVKDEDSIIGINLALDKSEKQSTDWDGNSCVPKNLLLKHDHSFPRKPSLSKNYGNSTIFNIPSRKEFDTASEKEEGNQAVLNNCLHDLKQDCKHCDNNNEDQGYNKNSEEMEHNNIESNISNIIVIDSDDD